MNSRTGKQTAKTTKEAFKKATKNTKKATVYDVAKEAGTSTATVSRVLSNSGYPVKEELRHRIVQVAKKLNYSPNMIGRMLKKSVSSDIGVIIPTISNPYYTQLVLGVELEARQRGYGILLCNSFRDERTEKKYIESLYQKQIRGIIISSIDENHTFLKKMIECGIKIVGVDQDVDDLNCSRVGFDYIKGGMLATEHLINMGHRDIAFISSPLTRKSRKETVEGYRLAMLRNNIRVNETYIITADTEEELQTGTYEFENGKLMVQKFLDLDKKPSAIFAVNDMTAFGVIQALLNNNVKVPEDVSVVGFDNIEFSSMINPRLTTVNQPSFDTGRLACKLLLDSINGKEEKEESVVSMMLQPTLIIRDSVRNILGEIDKKQ